MKKIISFVLAAVLLVSAVPTALATNDYSQGTQVVYEATGNESYTITVPAQLAPGGSGTVTLEGTWADNRIITVTAEPTVTLTNSIKAEDQKVLNVHFDGISEAGSNTGSQTFTEAVSVDDITNALFGTWSGKFNYNVDVTNSVTNILDPAFYAPLPVKEPTNIMDTVTLSNGYLSDTNTGSIVASDTSLVTNEIPVEAGKSYLINNNTGKSQSYRTLYVLDDGTYRFQIQQFPSSGITITIPENCVAFRFSSATANMENLTMVPAPTAKIATNGDSITELPYSWNILLKDYYYFSVKNYAIGGSTLASYGGEGTPEKTRDPLVERYTAMDTSADACMIAIGTNDWWYSWCDIGTDSDTTTTTFKGALHTVCKGLKEMYGDKPIIFITPIKRGDGTYPSTYPYNRYGKTLEDYANAIVDVCSQYEGIYVIDLYHTCPMDPAIPEHLAQFFDGDLNLAEGYETWYDDSTHPNVYGSRVQARYIISAVESIFRTHGLI